jgi:hypothetical protein
METTATTIVTAYFNIPSKKGDGVYKEWMKNMLIIENPMVIYTDVVSVGYISELRRDKMDITRILVMTFKEFYCYKYYDTFVEQNKRDHERRIGHSVELYMVWCEKSNFLKKTIMDNPFGTEYFLWVDIGCFREPNHKYIKWPLDTRMKTIPPGRVLLCEVYPFTVAELRCNRFEMLPDYTYVNRIGGTIFGGSRETLLVWWEKYYGMVEAFIGANRLIIKDQTIMNSVYLLNRDLCFLQGSNRYEWFYLQNYLGLV